MQTTSEQRRFYNPVQQDYVTFLETSRESNGTHTHALLEVAPGGKVTPHYHKTFSETFVVRTGTLHLQLGNRQALALGAGERAMVPPDTLHAWSNPSGETLVCDVILEPGNEGFKKALQAGYGLAADGLTHPSGLPKSIWHLALLVVMGESKLGGGLSLLNGVFGLLARLARRRGRHKDFEKYYRLS